MIGTLDPTLTDVTLSKDLKDTFIIRRKDTEIIIQDGKLLNREVLSSGTAEGIDVAVFFASMLTRENCFYYCDEHFSYIQSDIEGRIFGMILDRISGNSYRVTTCKEYFICRQGKQSGKYSMCCTEEYQVSHVEAVVWDSLKELISILEWLGVKTGTMAKDKMRAAKNTQSGIQGDGEQTGKNGVLACDMWDCQISHWEIYG